MQVSLTYTPVGYATKGGAAWSKEGWGEQQLGRRRAGVACKSQEMGIGGSSWEWTFLLWRPKGTGCNNSGWFQRVDAEGERGHLRDQ